LNLKDSKNLLPTDVINYVAKLVHTRRALSSTIINSHQEAVSGQACYPPDPHKYFPFLLVEEFYGTRCQSGSFSLINAAGGFSTACVVFSSYFLILDIISITQVAGGGVTLIPCRCFITLKT